MLILDLRLVLFASLLILVAVLLAALWLDRRLRRGTSDKLAVSSFEEIGPLFEQVPFGLLLLEGPGTCRFANLYARRLLELASPACDLPDAAWVRLLDRDREAVRQENAATGRYRSVALAANRSVRWWVTHSEGLELVFLLDVTAQQRSEEAARLLINDLSHELRTPLATILTHLEVLGLPRISQEIRGQSTQLLRAEAQRMARLVNLMLELGRLETSTEIERRPVDLLALVENVVAQINPQAKERNIAISIEADAPLPMVTGDGDRLRQAFLNLLDNAVKYARTGDRVAVSLKLEEERIRCVVSDSGPGIPARHLPYITRRFYRAAPQHSEGSGLGLALVEEILRRHGSSMEIESQAEGEETGTRVSFLLPIQNVMVNV